MSKHVVCTGMSAAQTCRWDGKRCSFCESNDLTTFKGPDTKPVKAKRERR